MRRFTVPTLLEEVDALVQSRFATILVEGEVGQLTVPASGHAYVQLRDKGGARGQDVTLQGVVWRDDWNRLKYRPKLGDRVICRGRVSVYAARGTLQLYINDVAPAGMGDLARQIEERKARLAAEGLLDPRRKRPLPAYPRVVGVATSETGAALQDFLEVSRRRWPAARVLLAPCFVQGAETPSSVIRAVELLLEDGRAEVIVVTRGGGSKEDLMSFNDEALARFLAHSPVPVVSAVGHQIDTTIADLVADVVAPTPSAAAMAVFPDGRELARRLDEAWEAAALAVGRRLRRAREQVDGLAARLRHPQDRVLVGRRRLVDLESRLAAVLRAPLSLRQARVAQLHARLHPSWAVRVERARQVTDDQAARAARAMRSTLDARRARLDVLTARLSALSPLGVLERGYAIVEGPRGLVSGPGQVAPGDALRIRTAGGPVQAQVVEALGR